MNTISKIVARCEHEYSSHFREMFISPLLSVDLHWVSSRDEWQRIKAEQEAGLRPRDILNDYATYSSWSQFFLSFVKSAEFESWSNQTKELTYNLFNAVQIRYACQLKPAGWSLDAFRGDARYARKVSVPERSFYWLFTNLCMDCGTHLYRQMSADSARAKEYWRTKVALISALLQDLGVIKHHIPLLQSHYIPEWDSPFYVPLHDQPTKIMFPRLLIESYPHLVNIIHCNDKALDALYGPEGYHSDTPEGRKRNIRTKELAKKSAERAALMKDLGLLPSKSNS